MYSPVNIRPVSSARLHFCFLGHGLRPGDERGRMHGSDVNAAAKGLGLGATWREQRPSTECALLALLRSFGLHFLVV
jgi:hypothetical protein